MCLILELAQGANLHQRINDASNARLTSALTGAVADLYNDDQNAHTPW